MKSSGLILLVTGLLAVTNSCSQQSKSSQKELGLYVGATPCLKGSQPVSGIPQDSDCEFIKWKLTLYVTDKNEPSNYKLEYEYGISQESTQGFKDGKIVSAEGKWQISKGTNKNPAAVVYQLDPDKPSISISFIKLSDGILHLLDMEKRLLVGNAGYSFTLNKVSK